VRFQESSGTFHIGGAMSHTGVVQAFFQERKNFFPPGGKPPRGEKGKSPAKRGSVVKKKVWEKPAEHSPRGGTQMLTHPGGGEI